MMGRPDRFDRQEQDDGQARPVERLSMLRVLETSSDGARVVPRNRLAELASKLLDSRRKRARFFHDSLLGEPGWDMLLALFCLPCANWKGLTVSGLSEAAQLPLTTSVRWSKVMERQGLIDRRPDPLDARKIFVALTEKGERLMCDYLSSVYHRMVNPDG